ncbi:MAG: glutamyl-tRNA reductase [Clostridiales bacterium]|nr:glutamyl-tRNA reductase [Clostridiales bacterium]MCF8021926.1 glutamyl-tRNA reductase [Clostridiales bacterium]
MSVLTIGLNHKTAPVEIREKLSFAEHSMHENLTQLQSNLGIEGSVILSTCNRTEIYTVSKDEEQGLDSIVEFLSVRSGVSKEHILNFIYIQTGQKAVEHLFKVTSGLDSMLIGETQILGQVRSAYEIALKVGSTNSVLNTLFQQAINTGKAARAQTGIDQHAVSISYAAVELAKQVFKDLTGRKVLVIGAGKMSELTTKHLVSNGVSGVIVSNRSFDRAVELARQFNGIAVKFDELFQHMEKADIVISCTAATHYVVRYHQVMQVMDKQPGKKLMFIDIAVPRDIQPDVREIENVTVYDIDALQNVVDNNINERKQAAIMAETIIIENAKSFIEWEKNQYVIPTITELKHRGEEIKQKELRRAYNRLGEMTDHQRKVVSSMANSIVNQLLHDPVTCLKSYASTEKGAIYTEALQNLFKLNTANNVKEDKDNDIKAN